MPFTLAHPAAVLPLRRYCPRLLSFPALIIGSFCPDVGYAFGDGDISTFSHRLLGSLGFCLPVGLVLLVLFYFLRGPAVGLLPAAYRQTLLPLSRRPLGSPWAVLISLVLGTWTHLLWDSFTHNEGWFVQHLSVLQTPILSVGSRTARVCHLLWYGCSFAGVVWLFLVFEQWQQTHAGRAAGTLGKTMVRDAVVVAILVLPIQLVHHLARGRFVLVLIAGLCALVLSGVLLKMSRAHRGALTHRPGIKGRNPDQAGS